MSRRQCRGLPDSIPLKRGLEMATFQQLWNNHPANWTPPDPHPCKDKSGDPAFRNQCAIRMGLALQGAGINTNSVPGARCWHGHGRSHILRVRNLVPWIESRASTIACKKKVVHKNVTHNDFTNRKGIVYFQNFWGANNQGDHIDLWNGTRVAKGALDYFSRSEEVWFWEM